MTYEVYVEIEKAIDDCRYNVIIADEDVYMYNETKKQIMWEFEHEVGSADDWCKTLTYLIDHGYIVECMN